MFNDTPAQKLHCLLGDKQNMLNKLLYIYKSIYEKYTYDLIKSRTGCKTSSTAMVLLSLELVVKQVVLL